MRISRPSLCTVLGALTVMSFLPPPLQSQQRRSVPTPNVAGTYSFVACEGRCGPTDTSRAYAVGLLVLFADTSSAPSGVTARWQGRANGCFQVRELRDRSGSMLGIQKKGGLRWTSEDEQRVGFDLYRSPDASYHVKALIRSDSLFGRGRSSGPFPLFEFRWFSRDEYISGLRIGPPDPVVCATVPQDHD